MNCWFRHFSPMVTGTQAPHPPTGAGKETSGAWNQHGTCGGTSPHRRRGVSFLWRVRVASTVTDGPTRTTAFHAAPNKSETGSCFPFFRIGNCCFFFFVRSIFKAQEWQKDPPRFHLKNCAQPGLFHNLSCEEQTQVFFQSQRDDLNHY